MQIEHLMETAQLEHTVSYIFQMHKCKTANPIKSENESQIPTSSDVPTEVNRCVLDAHDLCSQYYRGIYEKPWFYIFCSDFLIQEMIWWLFSMQWTGTEAFMLQKGHKSNMNS